MKLTDVERDWCEENPDVFEALAAIHESQGSIASSMEYENSATYHFNRAAELYEQARQIRQSWED